MEGRKEMGSSSSSSSSSFTSELFGSTDQLPSTTKGIFGSIFAPPSKVLGRESLRPDLMAKRQDYPSETWNTKAGLSANSSKQYEGENQGFANRDMSSLYQDQRVQPCHLSSSIFYGGQDVYSYPQSNQGSELNSVLKNESSEDDSGIAYRGNWWQGSLYY